MDAENARAIAKVMAKNPQITEEMMAGRTATGAKLAPVIVTIAVPITVLLIGLATWLGGKLAGAAVSMGAAMMIATYSYFPRVLELLVVRRPGAAAPRGTTDRAGLDLTRPRPRIRPRHRLVDADGACCSGWMSSRSGSRSWWPWGCEWWARCR